MSITKPDVFVLTHTMFSSCRGRSTTQLSEQEINEELRTKKGKGVLELCEFIIEDNTLNIIKGSHSVSGQIRLASPGVVKHLMVPWA